MASQWREATLLGTSTLSTLFYTWRYHYHHHHHQQQHQHSQRHHHYHDPHHHDHHYHRIKEICYIGLRQGLAHLVPATLGGGQGGQVRHRVGRHHCHHAQNDKLWSHNGSPIQHSAWQVKWWLFLVQPPGSVYLSSPFAFRHAVGHEDINRCRNYLLNCIWTSLMRLVMLCIIWYFINRSCTSVSAIYGSVIIHFRFRESRIVAVQCRVSLYQSRCSQGTFFLDRDDFRG